MSVYFETTRRKVNDDTNPKHVPSHGRRHHPSFRDASADSVDSQCVSFPLPASPTAMREYATSTGERCEADQHGRRG